MIKFNLKCRYKDSENNYKYAYIKSVNTENSSLSIRYTDDKRQALKLSSRQISDFLSVSTGNWIIENV